MGAFKVFAFGKIASIIMVPNRSNRAWGCWLNISGKAFNINRAVEVQIMSPSQRLAKRRDAVKEIEAAYKSKGLYNLRVFGFCS